MCRCTIHLLRNLCIMLIKDLFSKHIKSFLWSQLIRLYLFLYPWANLDNKSNKIISISLLLHSRFKGVAYFDPLNFLFFFQILSNCFVRTLQYFLKICPWKHEKTVQWPKLKILLGNWAEALSVISTLWFLPNRFDLTIISRWVFSIKIVTAFCSVILFSKLLRLTSKSWSPIEQKKIINYK